jgi:hypothetical protein
MGYDESTFEHENGYSHTAWIGNDNLTIQVERESHYSITWSTDFSAANFMSLIAQLPDIGNSEAVAYTWSTRRNVETTGSELLREWQGLDPNDFSADYAFLRIDVPSFGLAWQIVPAKGQQWRSLPPPERLQHSVLGIASNDIDPEFIVELVQDTCTKQLYEDQAQQVLRSELGFLIENFKHNDWSAFLAKR